MALILLIISPLITIILSFFTKKSRGFLEKIALTSTLIELVTGIYIVVSVAKSGSYSSPLLPFLEVNSLEAFILFITVVIGFVATLYSVEYLRRKMIAQESIGFKRIRQYYMLLRLFLVAMFIAIATTNPMIMWIAIEATTLSTAFLISFYNRPSDIEASWKYLIINTVGLLFGLLGTLLFLTPGFPVFNAFIGWKELLSSSLHVDPMLIKFAFVFTMIGYGTKLGIAPLHTWKPDAYNRAPSPIVALLAGALVNVAILAILRFKIITDALAGTMFTQNLFIAFGIFSIVFAAFIIYTQTNYKRLLAYSSIENAGIIMLGFGFGGIGIFAALLHMLYHAFAKSLLFLLSGNIYFKYGSDQIKNVRGALKILPITSVLLILAFLAITGIPPFGTFLTELYIILAGLKNHAAISIVAIIGFILVFIGFFRSVFSMVFGQPPSEVTKITKGEKSYWTTLPLIGLLVLILILSLYLPTFLQTLIHNASNSITKPI